MSARSKTIVGVLLLLLLVVGTTTAFTTCLEWQEEIYREAKPLTSTPLEEAQAVLKRDGVVKLEGVSVDAYLCTDLRETILSELATGNCRWDSDNVVMDYRFIPGTRIRLASPVDVVFAGDSRHDILLPLESNTADWKSTLGQVLQSAAEQLQPLLLNVAGELLPRDSNDKPPSDLELVELGSLVSRMGSSHQKLHGDYRRYPQGVADMSKQTTENTQQAGMGKMPPRLVTFIALQDIPNIQHGATGFVTGTHNAEAHELLYNGKGLEISDTNNVDNETIQEVQKARQALLNMSTNGVACASNFKCGDVLVYDASVLHWGGPNRIPNHDRAIMYFGVAKPFVPSQEELNNMAKLGFKALAPISFKQLASSTSNLVASLE